jgi:hypothetical protein
MLPRDEILFLNHAARELRSMAKRAPDIADELRKMVDEFGTKMQRREKRSIHSSDRHKRAPRNGGAKGV